MEMHSNLQNLMMSRTDGMCCEDSSWDCGQVIPGLFVGSLRSAKDQENLMRNNVTRILTAAGRLILDVPDGVEHMSLNIADHPCANLLEELPHSFEFIDAAMNARQM